MTQEDNEVPQGKVPDVSLPHQVPMSPRHLACGGDGMAPMSPTPYLRCR